MPHGYVKYEFRGIWVKSVWELSLTIGKFGRLDTSKVILELKVPNWNSEGKHTEYFSKSVRDMWGAIKVF